MGDARGEAASSGERSDDDSAIADFRSVATAAKFMSTLTSSAGASGCTSAINRGSALSPEAVAVAVGVGEAEVQAAVAWREARGMTAHLHAPSSSGWTRQRKS